MDGFPQTLDLAGRRFLFVKERRAGLDAPKTALYAAEDGTAFLRAGAPTAVARELDFHRRLSASGFPVASVRETGTVGAWAYWIEASLGTEHFGEIFRREMAALGGVSDGTFDLFLDLLIRIRDAQAAHAFPATDALADRLFAVAGVEGMVQELPDQEPRMRVAWAKIRETLCGRPFCLTHGDLTAHNLLPGGVIDFGDHFDGPFGYDLVSAITAPFWFPERGAEYTRWSRFTRAQVERALTRLDPDGTGFLPVFDALFVLKAHWWAVRNHSAPILQQWRYGLFADLLERYVQGESIFDGWKSSL